MLPMRTSRDLLADPNSRTEGYSCYRLHSIAPSRRHDVDCFSLDRFARRRRNRNPTGREPEEVTVELGLVYQLMEAEVDGGDLVFIAIFVINYVNVLSIQAEPVDPTHRPIGKETGSALVGCACRGDQAPDFDRLGSRPVHDRWRPSSRHMTRRKPLHNFEVGRPIIMSGFDSFA